MGSKREVPEYLSRLLKLDTKCTNNFITFIRRFIKPENHKSLLKGLEISGHGLLWLGMWLGFVWIFWRPSLFQMQINFFIGLVMDIVLIAMTKAFFRRRRPSGNKPDMFLARGPDLYSFPSGHVSRAFLIAYFFTYMYPLGIVMSILLYFWAICLSASRLLLNRHFILDVIGGYVLAVLEYYFLSVVWISKESAESFVSYLTDESLEGGDYLTA